MHSSQPNVHCTILLMVVTPLMALVLTTPASGQVPPARLEVHVTPAVEGLVVEVLGMELVRRTDAGGVAVIPVPPGFVELEVRAPTGESTRQSVNLRPEGQIETVDFSEIAMPTSAADVPGAGSPIEGLEDSTPPGVEGMEPEVEQAPDVDRQVDLPLEASGRVDARDDVAEPPPSEDLSTTGPIPLLLVLLAFGSLPLGAAFVWVRRQRETGSAGAPTRLWSSIAGARQRDRVGERLADFELEEVIGRGGMATVWRASADRGETVALKVMNPELAEDPLLRKKFLREGAVLEKIQANWPEAPIVRVRNWGPRPEGVEVGGASDPTPWVALEYLEGRTLLQHIRDSPHPFEISGVLRFAGQVALGLRAAHDCGVYHRDLTPDNILLLSDDATDPVIRLIDFGVARHEFTEVHTLDGSIFGKPPYMAPEQGRGLVVDGRADLYSLGIIVYLLLTGETPFSDSNPLMVLQMHSLMPPPPLPEHLPSSVIEMVEALLEKDPEDRVPDAETLLQQIQALLNPSGHLVDLLH